MATHSSVPAWRIPWTEEPVRLQSLGGDKRVQHNLATKQQQQENSEEFFFFSCAFKGAAQSEARPPGFNN